MRTAPRSLGRIGKLAALMLLMCCVAFVCDAPMASGQFKVHYVIDMNSNGIEDSADVANGLLPAQVGVDDLYCWADSSWTYEHGVLGPCVRDSLGRKMQVEYRGNAGDLAMSALFAVPDAGSHVRIVLDHEGTDSVTVFAGFRPRGLQRVVFRPVTKMGMPMVQGSGSLRVTIAGKTYERPIAWQWRTLRKRT